MVPLSYGVSAVAAGLTVPRIEADFWPHLTSPMSVGAANSLYSATASGMLSLTGIVFSLTFVMVQFSANSFSPRLVVWFAQDKVVSHALGVFFATFLYSIAALAGVDRNASGKVPIVSVIVVVGLLLASMGMFIALIQRLGRLQVNSMLSFTGNHGRRVIAGMAADPDLTSSSIDEFVRPTVGQVISYHGNPAVVQFVNVRQLISLARAADAIVEVVVTVGDSVVESRPLIRVLGGRKRIHENSLRQTIKVGAVRTFEQDPKYALRLLVDIAIRALSPGINDPTTAVETLDQIEDLLTRLGRVNLGSGYYRDAEGELRLVLSLPTWGDLLQLAFEEIRMCGSHSVQVMRRMNALISDLISAVPEQRQEDLRHWQRRIRSTVESSFTEDEDRGDASAPDRQGLGAPCHDLDQVSPQ